MIQTLTNDEILYVAGGGSRDGETLASVAGAIGTVGTAVAVAAPPVGAALLAAAATTLLIAFVAEAAEG